MKKVTLITISLSLLFGGVVFAQETELLAVSQVELPDPGMTPDSPFYFLERMMEATRTFFTFGDLRKAERHAVLAGERLAEAQAMIEKGKPEFAEKTLARYENQLEKALTRAEKAKNEGKNTKEVANIISEATQKHITVLERVLEKVPEQAKPAIEQAITVSSSGGARALEAVSSGQEIEAIKARCLEMGGPSQVCNSIGEALASTKPLRTLCLEQGGTQEMCEMMPSKNFKSFKEIKDFCIEQGGPSEICETLEDKCRELGVTKADSCFRVLSISSVTTFTSTELKVVSKDSLSEEEMQMQQQRIQMESGESVPAPTERRLKQRYVPGVSKVIMYFLPTCPHCINAKEWLRQHNIEYEAIDISKSKAAGEELTVRTGSSGTPTIVMDNQVLVGFTEELYSEFFGVE